MNVEAWIAIALYLLGWPLAIIACGIASERLEKAGRGGLDARAFFVIIALWPLASLWILSPGKAWRAKP